MVIMVTSVHTAHVPAYLTGSLDPELFVRFVFLRLGSTLFGALVRQLGRLGVNIR
jgi:hypothetical protein